MNNFTTAVTNRRTNYTLSKDVSLPQTTIIKTVEDMVREVPSAFNMQSGKVVVAFGETHDAIWKITMDTLRKIVPPANFAATEAKINCFAAAYGTVLYFDDTAIVDKMAAQFPLYAKNFPIWAQQANGMMQFAIWTALTDLGLGVNVQHYNPLIDDDVKKLTGVPDSWQLIAQMPFGAPTEAPKPIVKVPIEERVRVKF
ncbi:nitroreductase family protein [uncultured Megasphaera sp.]|uniref:nitroreductase family protein n=1 Tax=uncultured Megasphaera sp. TaxID=165188 RepID=UPI0025D2E4D2|nr:nitroreductase family protein [uncultured Megasphaera sp.]